MLNDYIEDWNIEIDWVTEIKKFMPTVSCACNIKVLFLYIPCFALCKTCIIMHWIKMQEAGEFVYVNPFCVLVSLIQIKHFVKNFVQTIFLFIRGICTIGWSEYQKIDFSETWCSDSRMDLFKNLYIVIFHFRGGGVLTSLLPKNQSKWLKFEFLVHLVTKVCQVTRKPKFSSLLCILMSNINYINRLLQTTYVQNRVYHVVRRRRTSTWLHHIAIIAIKACTPVFSMWTKIPFFVVKV